MLKRNDRATGGVFYLTESFLFELGGETFLGVFDLTGVFAPELGGEPAPATA